MDSLNIIAENIAYQMGDQFNMTLRESIKDTLIVYRSKWLRDSDTKNFDDYSLYSQNLTIPLIQCDLIKEFDHIQSGDTDRPEDNIVNRSMSRIPNPIRHHLTHREPFRAVNLFMSTSIFFYTTLATARMDVLLPHVGDMYMYTFINNHIYIINNIVPESRVDANGLSTIYVNSIFDDPRQAYAACNDYTTAIDDRPFPISNDLTASVMAMVKKGEFIPGYTKDGQLINLKPDKQDDK